jgi:hypothetical protein
VKLAQFGQLREVRIRVLKLYFMVPSACRDEKIRGGNRKPGSTGLSRQIVSATPNRVVDRKLWQDSLKVAQHFLFTITAGTIPEFQSDHGAPARLAAFESTLHSLANNGVPLGA